MRRVHLFKVLFLGSCSLLLVRASKKAIVLEKSLTFCGHPLQYIMLLDLSRSVAKGEMPSSSKLVPFLLLFCWGGEEDFRDSEPLNVHPLAIIEEPVLPISDYSNWVVQKAKSFHKFVGLSCEGFEEDLMVLLSAIESSQHQRGPASPSSSLSKSISSGHQELKSLASSINNDLKSGHSSKVKARGGTLLVH